MPTRSERLAQYVRIAGMPETVRFLQDQIIKARTDNRVPPTYYDQIRQDPKAFIQSKAGWAFNIPAPHSFPHRLLQDFATLQSIVDVFPEDELAVSWVFADTEDPARGLRGGGHWPADRNRYKAAFEAYKKGRGNAKFVQVLKDKGGNPRNLLNFTLHDVEDAHQAVVPPPKGFDKYHQLPGAKPLITVGDTMIAEVTDRHTACKMGHGTKWCTSDPEVAGEHIEEGPLYIVFHKGKRVGQVHVGPTYGIQMMDLRDRPLEEKDPKLMDAIRPALAKLGDLLYYSDYKHPSLPASYSDDNIRDKSFAARIGDWPEFEKRLRQRLKDEDDSDVADDAFDYAIATKKRWPELEKLMLDGKVDPGKAVPYMKAVGMKEWPELIPVLMQAPEPAAEYAYHVGHRIPELEPTIARYTFTAIPYAFKVVKGKWEPAEKAIIDKIHENERLKELNKDDHWLQKNYDQNIDTALDSGLKYVRLTQEPFPELEPYITRHPVKLVRYYIDRNKPLPTEYAHELQQGAHDIRYVNFSDVRNYSPLYAKKSAWDAYEHWMQKQPHEVAKKLMNEQVLTFKPKKKKYDMETKTFKDASRSARLAQRLAVRPIRLNRNQIETIHANLLQQLDAALNEYATLGEALDHGKPIQYGTQSVSPRGDKIQIVVSIQQSPATSALVGGGEWEFYEKIGDRGDIRVFLRENLDKDTLQKPSVRRRISNEMYDILAHEFTHASEPIQREDPDLHLESYDPDAWSKEDTQRYYNDPDEVRAWMRNMADHVVKVVRRMAEHGPVYLDSAIDYALKDAPQWWLLARNLTPENRKLIMRGIIQHVQDELPDLQLNQERKLP